MNQTLLLCLGNHTSTLRWGTEGVLGFLRQWHPTPVLLPRKSYGQRSLVGCSPGGCDELDMTEQLHFHFSLSCTGGGNGSPLQCPCLENPRDGVTQSRTRLKQFGSSSCKV